MASKLTYGNVVASLCLFVLLGGGAYAAVQLPRKSVGPAQLKRNAVTSGKVKDRSLRAVDFRREALPRGRRGPPGQPGPPGVRGAQGAPGPTGAPGSSGAAAPSTFAYVAADGTLDAERTQGAANGSDSLGVGSYCLAVLVPRPNSDVVTNPRGVSVTPEAADVAVFATVDPSLLPPGCATVHVKTTTASEGTPVDAGFYLAAY